MTEYGTQGTFAVGALAASSGLRLGISATDFIKLQFYSAVLTHNTVMSAANSEERAYTVTGVVTGETIIAANFQTAHLSGVVVGSIRISAADTIRILWANVSAAASTNSAAFATDLRLVTLGQ